MAAPAWGTRPPRTGTPSRNFSPAIAPPENRGSVRSKPGDAGAPKTSASLNPLETGGAPNTSASDRPAIIAPHASRQPAIASDPSEWDRFGRLRAAQVVQ